MCPENSISLWIISYERESNDRFAKIEIRKKNMNTHHKPAGTM